MISGATRTRLRIADDVQRDMPAAEAVPIVAAVDESTASAVAVETAVNLAGELDAPIVFVYVRRGPAGFLGTPVYQRRLTAEMTRGRRVLDEALQAAAAAGVSAQGEILEGSPRRRIAEFARRSSSRGVSTGSQSPERRPDVLAVESRLQRLSALGQSVWIDFLSRDLLESGALARALEEDAVVGVTSNPSIFEQALSGGHAYDAQIAARGGGDLKRTFLDLAIRDVAAACDLLRPIWERTNGGDGYVSIEVDPNLADDTNASIDEATMLHDAIARPNLLVKIPATDAGLGAIEEMTARGRSINVTLIFSLTRHRQVLEAYLTGLERLIAAGGDPARVHSAASFFVSRVDTETDRRLDELGRDDLKGRLGIANARLAYQQYKLAHSRQRWNRLAEHGATKQRCLWASMSTKDPAYRDTRYVEELIGRETISTMPEETIRAFQDHGHVEPRLESNMLEARLLPTQLLAAGVDYDDVVATLEREGIEKFVAAFGKLLDGIADKRRGLALAA